MAKGNIEIEVKFPLNNPEDTLAVLARVAEYLYESRQVDEYFNAPHRDFFGRETVDDWLRIRTEANGKASFNYKHWYQTLESSSHCDEFETGVESADAVRKILGALQFEPVIKVDKLRRAFKYGDIEIAVDDVKDLGFYIEAEYCGDGDISDKEKIKDELAAALHEIGADLGEVDTRGYPYYLLERSGFIKKKD